MLKIIYIFAAIFWAAHGDRVPEARPTKPSITPYNMYDQVEKKLENLKEVLGSAISSANTKIKSENSSYWNYADGIAAETKLEIDDESNKINGQITVIQNLATTAGADISTCLMLQPNLYKIYVRVLNSFQVCIKVAGKEVDDYVTRAFERVTATKDDVRDLETQLRSCSGQGLSCLFPVVSKIDLDMIELPELIAREVNKCGEFIKTLTPQVDQCAIDGTTTYVTQANDIVGQIEYCADNLMK